MAITIGLVEAPHHFRRHGQVCVQNSEEVLGCMRKAEPDGVRLALAGLFEYLDFKSMLIGDRHALNLLPGAVGGMRLYKNDFCLAAEVGKTLQGVLDIAPVIARRYDTGNAGR